MQRSFIVFLKNKTSFQFKYAGNVRHIAQAKNGYRVTFSDGRSYNYGADKVQYYPLLATRENVRIYEQGKLNQKYNAVDSYGRYLIFRNGDYCSDPVENDASIEICDIRKDNRRADSVISYFKRILKENTSNTFDIQTEEGEARGANQISNDILIKAIENLDLKESRSVLSKYIDGVPPASTKAPELLIYPFGCNESQQQAVKTALSNSLSIIEGPPGTGKTQTILNIIANLIAQEKTVAIVSNNNSAVFNVREKLAKYGYETVVASLGNSSNKATFFGSLEKQTVPDNFKLPGEQLKMRREKVRRLDAMLTECFQQRNRFAYLTAALSDAEIEFSHLKAEQPLDPNIKSILDKKFYRKWSVRSALKLKELVAAADREKKYSVIDKLRFTLQYGLFDLDIIRQYHEEFPVYVNHRFYEIYTAKLKKQTERIKRWLQSHDEKENLGSLIKASKEIFNGLLYERYSRLNAVTFTADDYRRQFDQFTARYPVILSSTLSLHTSIPKGHLFDYLIIDEASQVDVIKSAVCFSCCRNAIVVGDSMQLTHIVDEQSRAAAEVILSKYTVAPAYDYVGKNILDSLKTLYGHKIEAVLLKEHYRCHPLIIGFCNKKYYSNNLAIMTSGQHHPFRIIETNISGEKDNYNQRQIAETDLYIRERYATDYTKVGVIAPYRNHTHLLQQQLPPGIEADTIHKFQGREKEVIIFNTVKNKISAFIDNPNLINVAVSRAVKEFVLVKSASMELPHGTNIGDLIRYMCYTTDPKKTIVPGRIRSVFDLLYKEYNQVFVSFISSNNNLKGSAAEIIIDKLLREKILVSHIRYAGIDMAREYKLSDLIRDFQPFTEEETRFIRSNSRLDFLLYNKIDKTPILAIEVDGVAFHANRLQQQRDNKKDHILKKIGLPLLRLSTDGHSEEARILEHLNAAMGITGAVSVNP